MIADRLDLQVFLLLPGKIGRVSLVSVEKRH